MGQDRGEEHGDEEGDGKAEGRLPHRGLGVAPVERQVAEQVVRMSLGDGSSYCGMSKILIDACQPSRNRVMPSTGVQTKGLYDAFVTKLNSKGSALVYSTYLGGTAGVDRGWAIALDTANNAYITGDTASTTFRLPMQFRPHTEAG